MRKQEETCGLSGFQLRAACNAALTSLQTIVIITLAFVTKFVVVLQKQQQCGY